MTEPLFGVIANWMVFITSLLLVVRASWLIKGVTPGVCPVIIIVVSSAWVAQASRPVKRQVIIVRARQKIFISDFLLVVRFGSAQLVEPEAECENNL